MHNNLKVSINFYLETIIFTNMGKLIRGIAYIIISFILWVIVEYLTVWSKKMAEWISLMPWILIQYFHCNIFIPAYTVPIP